MCSSFWKFYGHSETTFELILSGSHFIDVKNDEKCNAIIEAIPWTRPFINVQTMNIHLKKGNFFWKNDENIL